jgi:hypothetical protein
MVDPARNLRGFHSLRTRCGRGPSAVRGQCQDAPAGRWTGKNGEDSSSVVAQYQDSRPLSLRIDCYLDKTLLVIGQRLSNFSKQPTAGGEISRNDLVESTCRGGDERDREENRHDDDGQWIESDA